MNNNSNFTNTTVTFEYIDYIAKKICCNIITNAMKAGDGTKDGLTKALKNAGATELIINEHANGGFDINCDFNYIPTCEYALKAPYTLNLTISIGNDHSTTFMFGTSCYTLTKDGRELYCNSDIMSCIYENHPESFCVSDYLDLSKLKNN